MTTVTIDGDRTPGITITSSSHLPPPVTDHRQQFGAQLADLFRRGVRIVEFVEELLDSRIVGHGKLKG